MVVRVLVEFLLAETAKWRSIDGSMEGPDAFARDWNETAEAGGTREDVAKRWGIDPQVASNRAQTLKKMGYQMSGFKRGVKISGKEFTSKRQVIDPRTVAKALTDAGGDAKVVADKFGMTVQQVYGIFRAIQNSYPDIELARRPVGRPKAAPIVDPEEFERIWNSARDRDEAYEKFAAHDPILHKDRVNALARMIRRDHPDVVLKDLPATSAQWRLRSDEPQGNEYSSLFEPGGSEGPSDEDMWNELMGGSSTTASEPPSELEPAADEQRLTGPDLEFFRAWNSGSSLTGVVKQLKRMGWSGQAIKEKRRELEDQGFVLKSLDIED